jgi:hypothetical protein
MTALVMLDLFSGLGGASQAMVDRGWRVIRVELEEKRRPDVVADVRYLPLAPFAVDLLWASPPCTEYSRLDQPWWPHDKPPDLTLWEAAEQAIRDLQPRWWIIENVRGAQKFHGKTRHWAAQYLWSNIDFWCQGTGERYKENLGGHNAARRAKVPYSLSELVAWTVENLCLTIGPASAVWRAGGGGVGD